VRVEDERRRAGQHLDGFFQIAAESGVDQDRPRSVDPREIAARKQALPEVQPVRQCRGHIYM
jgi:hypothetical protein